MRSIVNTKKAPAAIGPYSQAVKMEGLVFTAGQIAIDPATNDVISGSVAEQTEQVMKNLKAVIEEAGAELSSIVKTTVYLTDPEDFGPMNEVYARYFPSEAPARTTIFITALPKNVKVEIDAIARL